MEKVKFEHFTPGNTESKGYLPLLEMCSVPMHPGKNPTDSPFGIVMKRRIMGEYKDICTDNYYIAYNDEKCLTRLWTGWGKHKDSIGNFGHFLTLPECRGMGLGRETLKMWIKDTKERPDAPLAFFCSAAPKIADIYRPYGFREILPEAYGGFLYMPLGDSPETFKEFCDKYYQPSDTLVHKKATLEYRHEVDCLLKFALSLEGIGYNIGKIAFVEAALVNCPEKVGMFFSQDGHCVGWSFDGENKIHPLYNNSKIIEE